MSKDDPDFAIRGAYQFHEFFVCYFFREINFMIFLFVIFKIQICIMLLLREIIHPTLCTFK